MIREGGRFGDIFYFDHHVYLLWYFLGYSLRTCNIGKLVGIQERRVTTAGAWNNGL